MGNAENEKTPAGRYLKVRMEQVGFRRKVDLADAAGVSPSTITRLFSVATYRPDVENVRKLAAALQVGPDELMAGMAGETAAPVERPDLHPLAAELGRMLAADSPLTAPVKRMTELLVDRAVESSRREMRSSPLVFESVAEAAMVEAINRSLGTSRLAPRPAYRLGESEAANVVITDQARRLSWLQTSGILPPVAVDKLTAAVEAVMAMMIPGGEPIPDASAKEMCDLTPSAPAQGVEKVRDGVR